MCGTDITLTHQTPPTTCRPWIELFELDRSDLCETDPCLVTHALTQHRDVYRLIGQGTIEENIYERQSKLEPL